ncbi:MAG: hypothetical protein C4B59_13855 [Candidatus Methanogaster sp.]|uniref:Uncharacterized protein n=1 Tax=Candidatus Methanogaster sp. TaxID=3386292 RepID=A0AC61KZL8_9EURY|nr:MAG: hypothetical protein C4B59_13855 [ANME-2 cluster archaeon]
MDLEAALEGTLNKYKKLMKDLSTRDIEINIDESTVMGIERDIVLMALGFLHKKGFIFLMKLRQTF